MILARAEALALLELGGEVKRRLRVVILARAEALALPCLASTALGQVFTVMEL